MTSAQYLKSLQLTKLGIFLIKVPIIFYIPVTIILFFVLLIIACIKTIILDVIEIPGAIISDLRLTNSERANYRAFKYND